MGYELHDEGGKQVSSKVRSNGQGGLADGSVVSRYSLDMIGGYTSTDECDVVFVFLVFGISRLRPG